MRISQRVDYAVRLLIALADQPAGTVNAIGELAQRLGLPRRFLEQQVTLLGTSGIVTCRRGASGGCSLSRPADRISVAEIIRALQGEILDVPHTTGSAAAEVWAHARDTLSEYLEGVTLADLARRQRQIDSAEEAMYYI